MICDEIVNSFYQNIISPFTSDYDSYSVKADCLMIDKEAKRLSIRIYGHYTHQEAGTNTTVTMNYHNLPFDLTYNKVGSDEWPTG
ncbi:MAG: hypothetical protein MJ201_01295 [Mycoplasmoidaceae bacterium]|nr:hypothetical protein [Mycoplasmoidaceae bacterium]